MAPSHGDQWAGGGMTLEEGPKLGHFTSLNILASIQTPSLDYIFYPL